MADTSSLTVDAALEALGIGDVPGRARARAVLDGAGLTNPRRDRVSREKLPRMRETLASAFHLCCTHPPCMAQTGGLPVLHVRKDQCPVCSGSNTALAAQELITACRQAGIHKVCVVGGSPAVREELRSRVGGQLRLTLVDGTQSPDQTVARAHVRNHDVVLLCGASELDHRLSNTYAAWKAEGNVIAVARRGAGAILEALVTHARNRFGSGT